jgi:anti-sigma B factor antagonist
MSSFGARPEATGHTRARRHSSPMHRPAGLDGRAPASRRASATIVIKPEDTELDLHSSRTLARQLSEIDRTRRVLVDFSNVRFCDSSGVQVLVAARNRQINGGGSLHVYNPSPHVTRVFGIMGLDALLRVAPVQEGHSMRSGDQVVARGVVGGVVMMVPSGTRGVIVDARPFAGRYEVEFENGRTVSCRERDLLVSR